MHYKKRTSILLLCCILSGSFLFTSCSSTKYSSHKSYGYFSNPVEVNPENLLVNPEAASEKLFDEEITKETIEKVEENLSSQFSNEEVSSNRTTLKATSSIPELLLAPLTKSDKVNRFLQRQIVKKAERAIERNGIASINQKSLMYIGLVLILVGLIVGLVFSNLGFILVLVGIILILLHLIQMFE